MKRQQIVDCARTYIGTPFQHQGRLKGRALDCVGLPILVARELGLAFWSYANYEPQQLDETVLNECRKNLKEVPVDEMKPGDILCCRCEFIPCHVAIVTPLMGGLGIVHAYSPNDKVVEHTIDHKWRKRIAAVFQFPGVED